MLTSEIRKKLKPLTVHGTKLTKEVGNQVQGTCPFCDREKKFHVNPNNLLWDCKVCGESGNLNKFLEKISEQASTDITAEQLVRLAKNRNLPPEAFVDWGVGYNGEHYTIPVKNRNGNVVDIRLFRPGKNMLGTAGCSTGLLGSEDLAEVTPHTTVYVCEGEWDAIALYWLLDKVDQSGIVVSVPGATVFKDTWVPWFKDLHVVGIFDHDEAGENGEVRLKKQLKDTAASIRFVHWPIKSPEGFDARDFITKIAVTRRTPNHCFKSLQKLIKTKTRKRIDEDDDTPTRPSNYEGTVDFKEVSKVFNKWLYLRDTDAIEMCLAVTLSERLGGDPVWLFLVAPPGGSKTETIQALGESSEAYMSSSLTPRALISGAVGKGGEDPSLIPKLNNKVWLIKDFTTVMGLHQQDKDEIFAILRDAYDGKCSKDFGNGITRNYKSRFTIIAGVTPKVYELSDKHQSLGERFLKFGVGDNLEHTSEDDIIARAMDNISNEDEMRFELCDVCTAFLRKEIDTKNLPTLTPEYRKRVSGLAKFGARLRGTVSRDLYRNDIVISKAFTEVGSRLAKQLAKLGVAVAMVHGRDEVGEHEHRLLRKTILDTIPQRSEDIVRFLHFECPTLDDFRSTRDIALGTRYPLPTINRVLADLNILGIVKRSGKTNSFLWSLSKYIRGCIEQANLYVSEEEKQRSKPEEHYKVIKKRIRVKKKPKKKKT